jgi:hypothetical protein
MGTTTGQRVTTTVVAVTVAGLLAACAGGDPSAAGATGSASTASRSASTSEPATASTSPEPTGAVSTTVATGAAEGTAAVGRVVVTWKVPGAFHVAVGLGSVWVTVPGRLEVVRLDRRTGDVRATIAIGGPGAQNTAGEPTFVAVGAGAVWATSPTEDTVVRIDPSHDTVTDRIEVGDDPWQLAAEPDAVWVTNHLGVTSASVSRIDPVTGDVVATLAMGAPQQGPGHVAVGHGSAWVNVDSDNTVVEIDPRTNEVVTTVPVDGACGGVDVGRSVWVAARICGSTVTQVDPATGDVLTVTELAGLTLGVAELAGSGWVARPIGLRGRLTRIDAATGEAVGSVYLPHPVAALTAASGDLWTAGGDRVSRVAPRHD